MQDLIHVSRVTAESTKFLLSGKPLARLHPISNLSLAQVGHQLPELDSDVVVVAAGNLGPVEVAMPWLKELRRPTVYVPALQELRGGFAAIVKARELARGTQVHIGQRDVFELAGIRFICVRAGWVWEDAPLWAEGGRPTAADLARLTGPTPWREWLVRQLQVPFGGPTVVVSDSAPDARVWRSRREHLIRLDSVEAVGLVHGMGDGDPGIDLWIWSGDGGCKDELVAGIRTLDNGRGPREAAPLDELTQQLDVPGFNAPLPNLAPTWPAPASAQGTHGFDASLVVDLHAGWRKPLRQACAAARDALQRSRCEMAELEAFVARGNTVPDRCVTEAFASRAEKQLAIVQQVQADVLPAIDRHWYSHSRSGHPLPDTAGLALLRLQEDQYSHDDFLRLLAQCDQWLAWLEALPEAPARHLRAWLAAVRLADAAAQRLGVPLFVRRLPVAALRRLDNHEMHFLMHTGSSAGTPGHAASFDEVHAAIDVAINPERRPRRWRFSLRTQGQGGDFVNVQGLLDTREASPQRERQSP